MENARVELMNYLKEKNINYTKTKNNYPDMRCCRNKQYRAMLIKKKLLEKIKRKI